MSYELLVLPVPAGGDVEEAGEALEVRLAGGHVHRDPSPAAAARRRALASAASAAEPSLAASEEQSEGRIELADGDALTVEVAAAFAVFRVAYRAVSTDAAEETFERLFRAAGALVAETGWRLYDPQGACAVAADDEGRDATLEIYLSVLDQIGPTAGDDPPV